MSSKIKIIVGKVSICCWFCIMSLFVCINYCKFWVCLLTWNGFNKDKQTSQKQNSLVTSRSRSWSARCIYIYIYTFYCYFTTKVYLWTICSNNIYQQPTLWVMEIALSYKSMCQKSILLQSYLTTQLNLLLAYNCTLCLQLNDPARKGWSLLLGQQISHTSCET